MTPAARLHSRLVHLATTALLAGRAEESDAYTHAAWLVREELGPIAEAPTVRHPLIDVTGDEIEAALCSGSLSDAMVAAAEGRAA